MRPDLRDAVFVVGWLLFVGGVALLSVPAGLAAGGAVLMGVAVISARHAGQGAQT